MPSRAGRGRRNRRWRLLLGGLALGLVAVIALAAARLSHQVGVAQGQTERARLLTDLAAQQRLSRALAERAAVAEQRTEGVTERAAQLQRALDASLSPPELRALIDLLRERLAAGVAPQRLELVLRAVGGERACDPAVERKRLSVVTPTATEPATGVAFASSRIAVSAEGAPPPAGSSGARIGGFDPAQAVTVRFRPIGREGSAVTGALPLSHAIVLDETEILFLARADQRAERLEVTAQACRFP